MFFVPKCFNLANDFPIYVCPNQLPTQHVIYFIRRARFKIILTGTPVQNNLSETYALLHYMLPTIFDLDCGDAFADSFSLNNTNISNNNNKVGSSGESSNGAASGTTQVRYILRCLFCLLTALWHSQARVLPK